MGPCTLSNGPFFFSIRATFRSSSSFIYNWGLVESDTRAGPGGPPPRQGVKRRSWPLQRRRRGCSPLPPPPPSRRRAPNMNGRRRRRGGGGGEGHARSTRIRGAGCGGGQRNVPRAAVARPSATPAAAAKGAQPAGRSGPHSFVAVHGGRGGLWARDGRHWRPKRRGPDRLSAHRDPHPAAQPPRRRDRSRRPAAVGRPSKKKKNCSSPQRRRRASQRAPPPPHPTPPPAGGATRVPARVPAAQSVRCRHDPRVTMTKMATKQSTAYATPVAAVRPARRPTR